jgi:hypothetical protein
MSISLLRELKAAMTKVSRNEVQAVPSRSKVASGTSMIKIFTEAVVTAIHMLSPVACRLTGRSSSSSTIPKNIESSPPLTPQCSKAEKCGINEVSRSCVGFLSNKQPYSISNENDFNGRSPLSTVYGRKLAPQRAEEIRQKHYDNCNRGRETDHAIPYHTIPYRTSSICSCSADLFHDHSRLVLVELV